MRILVVAATEFEVEGLRSEALSLKPEKNSELLAQDLRIFIAGVGMVATAFALGKHLATHQYDLAINLGIAGSFDRNIKLGEVVEITEDSFAELGAEDDDSFLTIGELGFGESAFKPTTNLSNLCNTLNIANPYKLRQATAITVNTVHGHEPSIKKLTDRMHPQLESMEGAAFFYACKEAGIPCLQIRAVSNYVEKRNKSAWQIGLAIKNLNSFAVEFLREVVRNT